MSMAGAECVSAPTETKPAPVAASSGIRSSVTPPEISIGARPRVRATASRISPSDRLSSRILSAPAASASSTCSRRLRLDFDRQPGTVTSRVRSTAAVDAAGEPDVIVLDQHRVEQSDAMVRRAAGAHRVFLERAQRRRGLSGVEHGDPPARRVDESARARRDAREPLEKIERGALRGQAAPRRTDDFGDFLACPAASPSCLCASKESCGLTVLAARDLAEGFERHVEPGDDAVGLDEEHAACALGRRDRRGRRDVAVSDVLVERAPDDVAIERRIERLDHDAAGSASPARLPGRPAS